MDEDVSDLRAIHRKARGGCALGVLAMWVEVTGMTGRDDRLARRRAQFNPDAFDNDRTDRATMVGALIVLGLLIGGLWWLGR